MSPAYLKQAPTGVPGDVTRTDESNVEPAQLVPVSGTIYPTAFGIAMKDVAGGFQQFNGGAETAANFAGVLVREAPGISGALADDNSLNGGSPYPPQNQGILVRGYISVVCTHGTPARGGTVYVQIIADTNAPVGSFRADGTDGSNAIALSNTQASWASDGTDANGNAELRVAR